MRYCFKTERYTWAIELETETPRRTLEKLTNLQGSWKCQDKLEAKASVFYCLTWGVTIYLTFDPRRVLAHPAGP